MLAAESSFAAELSAAKDRLKRLKERYARYMSEATKQSEPETNDRLVLFGQKCL